MRQKAPLATLFMFVLLAGCGATDAELAALDDRVSRLEELVDVESVDPVSNSRELQEATQTEGAGDRVEGLAGEADLIAVATAVLPTDSLFAELDPEFGGLALTGDSDLISIEMVRSGLDDQPFVARLLEVLQFPAASVSAFESEEQSGDAVSETGLYRVEWARDGERIGMQIWALGPIVETETEE